MQILFTHLHFNLVNLGELLDSHLGSVRNCLEKLILLKKFKTLERQAFDRLDLLLLLYGKFALRARKRSFELFEKCFELNLFFVSQNEVGSRELFLVFCCFVKLLFLKLFLFQQLRIWAHLVAKLNQEKCVFDFSIAQRCKCLIYHFYQHKLCCFFDQSHQTVSHLIEVHFLDYFCLIISKHQLGCFKSKLTRTSADRVLKVVASMKIHDEELFVEDLVANQLVLVKIYYFW